MIKKKLKQNDGTFKMSLYIIGIILIVALTLYYIFFPIILENLSRKAISGDILKEKLFNPFFKLLSFIPTPNIRSLRLGKILREVGDYEIEKMWVCRDIIPQKLQNIADYVCKSEIKERLNTIGYDDAFHTYIVFRLKNPKGGVTYYKFHKTYQVTLEKIITQSNQPPIYLNIASKCKEVKLDKNKILTINQLLNQGEEYFKVLSEDPKNIPQSFWAYDPEVNNCQHFLIYLLESQGLLTVELEYFIDQAAQELVSGNNRATWLARAIASGADILSYVDGICQNIR